MDLSALLIGITFLVIGGAIFGLPAFLPMIRKRARQSVMFRFMTIIGFSIVTFVTFFLSVAYLSANLNLVFSSIISCDFAGDGTCFEGFPIDEALEKQVVYELWLHAIIPPPMLSDNICFNDNPNVCETASRLYNDQTLSGYLFALLLMLIPATACGIVVYTITAFPRLERKKKHT